MHKLVGLSVAALMLSLLAGCEWEGANETADAWNDAYSWINFGGTYRPVEGQTYLVSKHAPSASSPAGVESASQAIGSGNGLNTTFSSALTKTPVVLGSITVTDGVETFTDASGGGSLVGSLGGVGSINYQTGAISVSFAFAPGPVSVRASFLYSKPGTPASPAPGSSKPIYSMSVKHSGNLLYITDNNGVQYTGRLVSISTAGGDRTGTSSGEMVINFEASGPNGIRITGTFQGDYTAPQQAKSATRYLPGADPVYATLVNRVMHGTWIEPGATGDIQGMAGSTVLTPPAVTP